MRPDVQNGLHDDVVSGLVFHTHVAVTCTTWTLLRALGGRTPTSRTRELPQGDGTIPAEVTGNQEVAVALWYIFLCVRNGVFFCLEHPIVSRIWLLPAIQWLLQNVEGVFCIELDQCAWVKRPGDWEPQDGDVRTKKGTRLLTNNPFLRTLEKRCADVVAHEHQIVNGQSRNGNSRSAEASAYPEMMARAYAQAVREAWVHNSRPAAAVIPGSLCNNSKQM